MNITASSSQPALSSSPCSPPLILLFEGPKVAASFPVLAHLVIKAHNHSRFRPLRRRVHSRPILAGLEALLIADSYRACPVWLSTALCGWSADLW
ncbi:hypothetical protein LshimejAT787_0411300 [Lyophyllum shimeji]|uniref:Uncharacterized protein n=1 Tax=Lyophyllum shimeji TaxID=47721 RepID=A0A9P3UKG4_LYOSH|nr:hypothetical protein LshimejAT787_0411300 [Lyophyllum shimeji]